MTKAGTLSKESLVQYLADQEDLPYMGGAEEWIIAMRFRGMYQRPWKHWTQSPEAALEPEGWPVLANRAESQPRSTSPR